MSAQQGRQSPEPETQSGAQVNDPPSDAKGVSQGGNNQEQSKSDVEVCVVLLYVHPIHKKEKQR